MKWKKNKKIKKTEDGRREDMDGGRRKDGWREEKGWMEGRETMDGGKRKDGWREEKGWMEGGERMDGGRRKDGWREKLWAASCWSEPWTNGVTCGKNNENSEAGVYRYDISAMRSLKEK